MASGKLFQRVGKGLVDFLDFSGPRGRPNKVDIPGRGKFSAAPIKEIDDAAEAYMKKHGIPGTHRIDEYPEFDEDFAKRIADEYDRAKHLPNDPEVRKAYDALLEETMEQYKALEGSGLDVRFLKDGMGDPYARSPSMGYADIVDNGRLWVFPTEQGYGSDVAADVSNHPLLKKVGRVGDKEDAVANDAFRVVHDVYGHFGPGNPFFRRQGEDRAWQHHGRMFTDEALPAMSAETRGQNSWVNSGPHAARNRNLSGGDTIYADQKATIMPPWVWSKDLGRVPKFAGGGLVDDAIGALQRWYHGTNSQKAGEIAGDWHDTYEYLDPLVNPRSLGLHVGTPSQANEFALFPEDNPRVIPLDVSVKNPLRLDDDAGDWMPHDVYEQLGKRGLVDYDSGVWLRLKEAMDGDDVEQLDAMMEVQNYIKDLGYDGVIYQNRVEGLKAPKYPRLKEYYTKKRGREIDDNELYMTRPTDEEFKEAIPEASDSLIIFDKKQYRSPFGDGPGVGYEEGGHVSDEDKASMTHKQSYGYGERPVKLDSLGETWEFGDAPYYARPDGTDYSPSEDGLQLAHDMARLGIYAAGPLGAGAGMALDTAEAVNSGDPTELALAAMFSPIGKAAKAAAVGGIAMANPDDAEAGIFGTLAKWGKSSAGRDALEMAQRMEEDGADQLAVLRATGWFKDADGKWKYELPTDPQLVDRRFPSGPAYRIGDMVDDPVLFEQYPEVADTNFRRMNESGAYYAPSRNEIVLGDVSSPYFNTPQEGGKLGVLMHEIEHKKANMNGWAKGMNLDEAAHVFAHDLDIMTGKNSPKQVRDWAEQIGEAAVADPDIKRAIIGEVYHRNPGEMIARRAQRRRKVTEREIYDYPAYEDFDRNPLYMLDPTKTRSAAAYLDIVNYLKTLEPQKE